jgi:hypothetical protein
MGEYLKNPLFKDSPFRKAEVEYPFYDKKSLNKDHERFVKEATPRKIIKDNSCTTLKPRETRKNTYVI